MAYITDLYLKGIRKGNVEIDKIYKNCVIFIFDVSGTILDAEDVKIFSV